jgi:ubiquinone/menaquinone biosynthesis C-methylase UbiE
MKVNRTSNFFDEYSKGFDSIYNTGNDLFHRLINKWFRKTMRIRFDKTIEACKPAKGKTALDVGSGPGHYGISLAKIGMKSVLGIDFAPKMVELAEKHAKLAKVDNVCKYEIGDFSELNEDKKYDFVILMGFMDYMEDPQQIIRKAMNLANEKVLFSFPASGGFLAWQRQIRYKFKCPLYLYSKKQLDALFSNIGPWECEIENITRDYFVTLTRKK